MFCSARAEVLGGDPDFIQHVKRRARIVKDTLLENSARWKKKIVPHGRSINRDMLQEFQHECIQRSSDYSRSGYGGGGPPNLWKDRRGLSGQDEMSQALGDQVAATFATWPDA